jgi:hypothetical protein
MLQIVVVLGYSFRCRTNGIKLQLIFDCLRIQKRGIFSELVGAISCGGKNNTFAGRLLEGR